MIVRENQEAGHELLNMVREKSGKDRLPGVHVHDLIHCARAAWARVNGIQGEESDTDTLTFLLGQGWHGILEVEGGEHKKVVAGGHATVDQIIDGMPIELKTTRSSANKDILALAHYVDQLAAYCLATGTTKGRIHVVHINGVYKPPTPIMKTYDIAFTEDELRAWERELEHRHKLIVSDDLPPVDFHWTWECQYCTVKDLIGCKGGKGLYDNGFFADPRPSWMRKLSA